MPEDTQVAADTSTAEEVSTELETESSNVSTEEEVDWEARAKKAEELAENYKTRAEKAEKKVKPSTPSQPNDLSRRDLYALMTAKVADEDIDEVADYARLKKISIPDAVKSSFIKTFLSDKEQARKAAAAANTGATRLQQKKASDAELLAKARAGELPESQEEYDRLWKLRRKK